MHRPALPALLAIGSLLLASSAHAAAVCIGKPEAPFAPATVVGEPATSVGFLAAGRCYGVLERLDSRTRIFVKSPTFSGEAEVRDDDLLQILAEDIPMTLGPGETPWGLALAGTAVTIEGPGPEGGSIVRTVDGRLQVRFYVESGAMLPAEVWPVVEPDAIHPGGKWPEAPFALPPAPTALGGPTGTRATLGAPLFDAGVVSRDAGLGSLRYALVEESEHEAVVRVVGPTVWVQGTTAHLDWRRASIADMEAKGDRVDRADWEGWDDRAGYTMRAPAAPQAREVGNKEAPITLAAKGDRFAAISAFARLDVLDTDGSWHKVIHRWDGGSVTGWLDKRRLTKEGKEQPHAAIVVPPTAAVAVAAPVVAWLEPGPPSEVDAEGNPKLDKEGQVVIDPNHTHVEPPPDAAPWLRRAVRERVDRLRFLYGRQIARRGSAASVLTLRIVVAEDGAIETSEFIDSTVTDAAILALLSEIVASIEPPERVLRKARKDTKDHRFVVTMTVGFSPFAQ